MGVKLPSITLDVMVVGADVLNETLASVEAAFATVAAENERLKADLIHARHELNLELDFVIDEDVWSIAAEYLHTHTVSDGWKRGSTVIPKEIT